LRVMATSFVALIALMYSDYRRNKWKPVAKFRTGTNRNEDAPSVLKKT